MSEKMISDLDKRLSMQEATVSRFLEAVEKQTNSTDKLAESMVQMTTRFDYVVEEMKDMKSEMKELKSDIKEAHKISSSNKTEIAVIKRGNKWQEWAERGVVAAIIGAIIWAMKHG